MGFTDLGNVDTFSTEMLEWRIARSDVIEYNGDLLNPPSAKQKKAGIKMVDNKNKKTIRGGRMGDSDDDDSDSDY